MTLMRFDPFRGFESLGRRMSSLANEFEKGMTVETGGFNPRIDILEEENSILVHAEIPGMDKSEIKISMNEDRMLTLKGEKKRNDTEEDKAFIRSERSFGSFSRSFLLPENIDPEGISAKFNNGVVEISIPKKEPEQPKEYEVNIS